MNESTVRSQYPQLSELIENKVLDTYLLAQKQFLRDFELPRLTFDASGKRVGAWAFSKRNLIQFNAHFFQFKNNWDDIVNQTTPHEIAHLICDLLFPSAKQAHGPEWRYVASKLGIEPRRCHNMEGVKEYKPQPRPYIYWCLGCKKEFKLTGIKHSRILNGTNYFCGACRGKIVFVRQLTVTIPA